MSQVLEGGEPFFRHGVRAACLLIHGFTATPKVMRGLGNALADQGHTVLGVRLFGHATSPSDLSRARWQDWLADVESGYQMLRGVHQDIVAIGFSQGGALALLLASQFPLRGVIAMSTPYALPPDPRLKLLRPLLRPLSTVWRFAPKGKPVWHDAQALQEYQAYPVVPTRAVPEVDALFREMRSVLPSLRLPVLLIHSRQDPFIPPSDMESIYAALGSAEKE
ncbi:MAG TPA: alpha/beta fold hydrolase, partial [Anaerolineales bacterium]|nr:alpha/beta fold hydrolase [Anaerolineales bacterium]